MYTVKVPLMHVHISECMTYFSKFMCKVYTVTKNKEQRNYKYLSEFVASASLGINNIL